MAIVYGQAISHIQYCQLGLLHYRGAGYLTFIISTASLSPLPSHMAIVYGQAISHIQFCQLGLLHYRGEGYLTFIISTASLSSQMAIVYGQGISHIQYCQLGLLHYRGAGYLTFIISTASLSPLSLFPNGHCIWAGYLPYPILPAGSVALQRCRLSHLCNINHLALSSLSSLLLVKPRNMALR